MSNKDFPKKISEEINFFKKVCPHFDELQETVGKIIKKQFENSKLKVIDILEIGCGAGNTTKELLECDKRICVVAIDVDNNALNYSRTMLRDFVKKKRVIFLKKDALRFLKSCKDSSFDVFASVFTLHNFNREYRREIIREIYRVLKIGGLFINGDKYAKDDLAKQERIFNWQIRQFRKTYNGKNQSDLGDKWIKHYLKDENEEVIMRERNAISLMKSLGFKDINIIYRKGMESILISKKQIFLS